MTAFNIQLMSALLAGLAALSALGFFVLSVSEYRSQHPSTERFDISRAAVFAFSWVCAGSLVSVLLPGVWGEWHSVAPVIIWTGWTIASLIYLYAFWQRRRGVHPLQRQRNGPCH